MQHYSGRIARGCTPFAGDGMGDLFVLDAVTGQVKSWHHECPKDQGSPMALTRVSENFEAFVSTLEVVKEEPDLELLRCVQKAIFRF